MSKDEIMENIKVVIQSILSNDKEESDYIKVDVQETSIDNLFEDSIVDIKNGFIITEIFNISQGVTIGGEGCTDIFSKIPSNINNQNLLIYKSLSGENIDANKITWNKNYIIFPYVVDNGEFKPAFYDKNKKIDVLDFNRNMDKEEFGKDILQKLSNRIVKGYISNTEIAEYLMKYYDKLRNREFEDKTIDEFNKMWYEYHRHRVVDIISKPKIVGRRLMKEPAFAIDDIGYLPKDSVICLIPNDNFINFITDIENIINKKISIIEGYKYILSFLNSDMFASILEQKRAKKRGGYVNISEKLMAKVVIQKPSSLKKDAILSILNS